jgi:cytochrome c biogenesis protein CcmG/thiol:disulfide interchange protein DsbE
MIRALFLLPLLLFAGLAVYFAVGLTKDPHLLPSALIDKPAPEFDLEPLKEGKPGLAKADLGGQVAMVSVFASWCVPCRAEHPVLMRLAEEKTVPLYGIAYKDQRKNALAWLDELGDPYDRIGYDITGRAGIEWGVYGVPETYIVDKEGRIRYRHVGPLFPETIEDTILPLLKELRK